MTNANFLPDDYEVPESESRYMKFVVGDNIFRLLSLPILGWVAWKGKKPYRFPMLDRPESGELAKEPRHFMAAVVYNYATNAIQILEMTQIGVLKSIKSLSKDKDWGSPLNYDINVFREGLDKNNTKYEVTPKPKKPLDAAIVELLMAENIVLEELFIDGDPFDSKMSSAQIAAFRPKPAPISAQAQQAMPDSTQSAAPERHFEGGTDKGFPVHERGVVAPVLAPVAPVAAQLAGAGPIGTQDLTTRPIAPQAEAAPDPTPPQVDTQTESAPPAPPM